MGRREEEEKGQDRGGCGEVGGGREEIRPGWRMARREGKKRRDMTGVWGDEKEGGREERGGDGRRGRITLG